MSEARRTVKIGPRVHAHWEGPGIIEGLEDVQDDILRKLRSHNLLKARERHE